MGKNRQSQVGEQQEKVDLWELDFNKFFYSAMLIFAVYALFEVLSHPALSLKRELPLSLIWPPFGLDINQHLQIALVCYTLTILAASGGLFMDLLARRRLSQEAESVRQALLANDGPFNSAITTYLLGPALLFTVIGLGFRLGAVHSWYGRGFIILAILLVAFIWRIIMLFKTELEKAQPESNEQENNLESPNIIRDVGLTLFAGVVITVLGIFGIMQRR